jgi:pimeloyl-ACP methyl ester carboxylesterase
MPNFTHGGVEIAYLDEGEGEPIVLVHGFASNKEAFALRQHQTITVKESRVVPISMG